MCSTIILGSDSQRFLAVNYDIHITHGLIASNLRGTIKENARQAGEKAVRWCVKYGSITFNQSSLELPALGMNEKGLVIALMWHDEGDFGEGGLYARLNPLQWIQYQLDTCQHIDEVIEGLKTVFPRKEIMPLHFILLDANGDSLVVEFINGDALIRKNPEYPMLTNSSYQKCLSLAQNENIRVDDSSSFSLPRFSHLYRKYDDDQQGKARVLADFEYLDEVSQTPGEDQSFPWNSGNLNSTVTAWSIHFCPSEMRILFKTILNQSIREIRMDEFNFDATSKYTLMDVNDGAAGSVAKLFEPYTKDRNRSIVRKTGEAFSVPEEVQESLILAVDDMYQNRATE